MTKLSHLLEKLRKRTDAKTVLQVAQEQYSEKSFTEEYLDTYQTAETYSFIPSALSVSLSSLVFVAVLPKLHWVLAVLIGLIVAAAYEYVKIKVAEKGLKRYLKGNGWGLLAVGNLLYIGSIVFAVFGTYNGYKLLEADTAKDVGVSNEMLYKQTVAHYDSLKAQSIRAHDSTINVADKTALAYFNANTVPGIKGKPTIRDASVKQYNALQAELQTARAEKALVLSNLELDRKRDLARLSKTQEANVSKAMEGVGAYLYVFLGLSLFVESLIFAVNWFRQYYIFRAYRDNELLEGASEYSITPDTLRTIYQMALDGAAPVYSLPINSAKGTITPPYQNTGLGFKVGPQSVSTPPMGEAQPPAPATPTQNTPPPTGKKGLPPRNCEKCGTTYTPSVSWQKYCGKDCNHSANGFTLKK